MRRKYLDNVIKQKRNSIIAYADTHGFYKHMAECYVSLATGEWQEDMDSVGRDVLNLNEEIDEVTEERLERTEEVLKGLIQILKDVNLNKDDIEELESKLDRALQLFKRIAFRNPMAEHLVREEARSSIEKAEEIVKKHNLPNPEDTVRIIFMWFVVQHVVAWAERAFDFYEKAKEAAGG
jgi:hypothetical protein